MNKCYTAGYKTIIDNKGKILSIAEKEYCKWLTMLTKVIIYMNIIDVDCVIVVGLSSYREKKSLTENFLKINKLMNFNVGVSLN
jgi:hypothetical protein